MRSRFRKPAVIKVDRSHHFLVVIVDITDSHPALAALHTHIPLLLAPPDEGQAPGLCAGVQVGPVQLPGAEHSGNHDRVSGLLEHCPQLGQVTDRSPQVVNLQVGHGSPVYHSNILINEWS